MSKVPESRERSVSERSKPVRGPHEKLEAPIFTDSLRLPTVASFADGFVRTTNDESLLAGYRHR